LITQLTTTARAATTTTATKAAATTITMTLSYSLILAFVGIAETTSAFVPFENNLNTVRSEVIEYCNGPAKYDKSSREEESGFGGICFMGRMRLTRI